MDERSEWAKVRDELHVIFTTMFTFTTMPIKMSTYFAFKYTEVQSCVYNVEKKS